MDAADAGSLNELSSLTRLKSYPEADGSTVFDHSLLWWVSELGSTWTHDQFGMHYVLAGGCGGAVQTGRYLQRKGESHNDLMLSILHAMGIEDQTFGNPAYCKGPLAGVLV